MPRYWKMIENKLAGGWERKLKLVKVKLEENIPDLCNFSHLEDVGIERIVGY